MSKAKKELEMIETSANEMAIKQAVKTKLAERIASMTILLPQPQGRTRSG